MGFDWSASETPFNMAMLYYQEFHDLRNKKQEAMLANDLAFVHECLEEMFTMVYFKLKEDEKKSIYEKLMKLRKVIPNVDVDLHVFNHSLVRFKDLMRTIDRELLIYMDKYHMIFPNINVTGGLKKLRDKYKLGDQK